MSERLAEREQLLDRVLQAYTCLADNRRLIVGIVGAPASGKSTLAKWLVERINDRLSVPVPGVVVPMDGYHLDNSILDRREWRSVKGAPHTFDVSGFYHLLQRLAEPVRPEDDDPARSIYVPEFDRHADLARCAACEVTATHRLIVVEGNYLLLQRPVWRELGELFDMHVMLDVPQDVLEQRLVKRWRDHGLDDSAAEQRALSNDIPNAHVVLRESASAHLTLKSMRQ